MKYVFKIIILLSLSLSFLFSGIGLTPVDTDGDGLVDYLDLDSDNDDKTDANESGLILIGNVGINGLDNGITVELADNYVDVNGKTYENNVFSLQDSNYNIPANGSNAVPLTKDFDYREYTEEIPFTCSDTLFISNKKNLETSINNGKMWMHQINRDNLPYDFSSVGDGYTGVSSSGYNAIGYNVQDNFIYGLDANNLIRIDSEGSELNLGQIEGLNPGSQMYAGEFDRDGFYYVSGLETSSMYKIDINQKKVVEILSLHYKDQAPKNLLFSDIAIDKAGEYFYTMLSLPRDANSTTTANGAFKNDKVVKIRLSDGEMTPIGGDKSHMPSSVSLVYSDVDGDVFMMNNESGYYKLNTQTGEMFQISSTSYLAYYNDGTSCPDANISEPVYVTAMDDINIVEGDNGVKNVSLKVHFSKATRANTGFDIRFIDGTAKDASKHEGEEKDYSIPSTTNLNVTLQPNHLTYEIRFDIIGDKFIEDNEQFTIELYNPKNMLFLDNEAVVTIMNDDLNLHIERPSSADGDLSQLYTQIVNRDFNYAMSSYDDDDSTDFNIDNMTFKIDLLDNDEQNKTVIHTEYLYIENGSQQDILKAEDMKIDKAIKDTSYKISFLKDINGSFVKGNFSSEGAYAAQLNNNAQEKVTEEASDHFAIRPAAFKLVLKALDKNNTKNIATNINSTSNHKLSAGYSYELNVTAIDFTNDHPTPKYDEQDVNATLIFRDSKTNCTATDDIKLKTLNFNEGTVIENAFKHSNVGKYELAITANKWSKIDENSDDCIKDSSAISESGDEKSGCNIEAKVTVNNINYKDLNLTFEPYKFDLSNFTVEHEQAGSNYLYMNNDSTTMGIKINGEVVAQDFNNQKTTNFTKECHASDVTVTFENNLTTDQNDGSIKTIEGTAVEPIVSINEVRKDNFNTITINANDFNKSAQGSSSLKILYNISKNENEAINPVMLSLGDMNASSSKAKSKIATGEHTPKGGKDLDSQKTFYYSQVVSQRKSYAQTSQQSIITPIFVDIYCKNNRAWCDTTMGLNAVGGNSLRTDRGWYIAKNHQSNVDGSVDSLASNNNKINTTFNNGGNLQDGKIPTLETQHRDAIEGLQEATITINTNGSPWLNSSNNKYDFKFKNTSELSGTGSTGHILNMSEKVEKNEKISW